VRRAFGILLLFWAMALAQSGLPGYREVDRNTAYWFLVNRVSEALVIGVPPVEIGRALENKRVTLVVGSEPLPSWASRWKVVRLGGGKMGGVLILGDGRFFVARKEVRGKEFWVILENPQVVQILQGYFQAALVGLR
jgi:hypothetical protein